MSDNLLVPPAPTLNQTPMGLALEPRALQLRLLSHRINAGFPSPAADYCEEGLDLNAYLVRNQKDILKKVERYRGVLAEAEKKYKDTQAQWRDGKYDLAQRNLMIDGLMKRFVADIDEA